MCIVELEYDLKRRSSPSRSWRRIKTRVEVRLKKQRTRKTVKKHQDKEDSEENEDKTRRK